MTNENGKITFSPALKTIKGDISVLFCQICKKICDNIAAASNKNKVFFVCF